MLTTDVASAGHRRFTDYCNAIARRAVRLGMNVGFRLHSDENADVGTVVAMMLPYVVNLFWIWMLIFIGWYLLAIRSGHEARGPRGRSGFPRGVR